jgi:hypothetical protein
MTPLVKDESTATGATELQPETGFLKGHLAGIDAEGRPLFLPEGSSGDPFPVAIGIPVADGTLVKSARLNRRALVARVQDDAYVLVGFLRERVDTRALAAGPGELEVIVDGETLLLSAERQIELRCGKASLLLRADGRVVLSGTYVVSTSRGPNKVRGATISLN